MKTVLVPLGLCLVCLAASAGEEAPRSEEGVFPPSADLMDNVPADFPRFFFSGHDGQAQLLGRYLWHHFSTGGGYGPTAFNQEYLTTSDLWITPMTSPTRRLTSSPTSRTSPASPSTTCTGETSAPVTAASHRRRYANSRTSSHEI